MGCIPPALTATAQNTPWYLKNSYAAPMALLKCDLVVVFVLVFFDDRLINDLYCSPKTEPGRHSFR